MAFRIAVLLLFFLSAGNNSFAQKEEEKEEEEGKQKVPLPGIGGSVTTIPALPVEWQASTCLLDFDTQVLGGLHEACGGSGTNLDRARCCPVLAAWLMAARAKLAMQMPLLPPPPAQPGAMPLLPDDSLVCVANMKAALDARGLTLSPPNASCDVVLCFCGIQLNQMTTTTCPNSPFFGSQIHPITSRTTTTITSGSSDFTAKSNLPVPLLPITSSSSAPAPSPALEQHNTSSSAKALLANCQDHSYKGCTRCLNTLTKINAGNRRGGESLHCDLMGLMSLLATNRTLYIPTVSAVVRALMYSGQPQHRPVCSPDWANMPLALDSTQFQQEKHVASSTSSSLLLLTTSFSPFKWSLVSSLLLVLVFLPSHIIL